MVPLPDGMGAKALYKAHVVPIVESFHQNLSAPMKLRPPTIPVWRNTHPNVTDHPGRVGTQRNRMAIRMHGHASYSHLCRPG